MKTRKAVIPSGLLEYVEAGEGIPLILLHGGTGSIDEWGPCIKRFAEKYRVIAYNRRGYGDSTPRETFPAQFFEEDVEDLLAFLDLLGLSQPLFFCAFSDGGTIALMFAAGFPNRVRAMVCAGAHIYVEEKALKGLAHAEEVFERRIAKTGLKETPQIRSRRAWFKRWLHSKAGPLSVEDSLSRIACPTLIIQGSEDEYAEIGHAQRISEAIHGSELWIVDGARHWIHGGTHADAFIDRVLVFLTDK